MASEVSGYIDKREFLAGLACRTQGWYVRQSANDSPTPGLAWRFYGGADIAERARSWLGDGRNLPRTPIDEAFKSTGEALADPASVLLYEASFRWNGLAARTDCIRRSERGWTLVEFKSGQSSKDGDVSSEYIDDIAYTAMVAIGAGLKVVGASLIVINRNFILGEGEAALLEQDVTAGVLARASEFTLLAKDILSAIAGNERPQPNLKFACKDCQFFPEVCLGKDVPDPLFIIPRLSETRFAELQKYERVSRLPPDVKLTETQKRVVDLIRSGKEHVNKDGLRALDSVVWPAYYLDFEAVMPYLPWFDGRPPYDAVPFQYSLHVRRSPDASFTHHEYLAPTAGDWRRELTERLLQDLGTTGSIIVYSSYEKTRLNGLAALFPDLVPKLALVVGRLFDLEQVFKNGYSSPAFLGKTSIKKVLPAMVPDLRYDRLEVNNGEDAAGVFALMRAGVYSVETHDVHRTQLLEYCKLDTLAMVRLHEAVLGAKARHSG